MRRRRLRKCSGESIVEVMVSIVVFLLLLAVLQGAMLFSNAAQQKSRQIREDTAAICEKLPSVPAEGSTQETYMFYATSADGSVIGDQVFSIPALQQRKTVSYAGADGGTSEVIFYLYGPCGGMTP